MIVLDRIDLSTGGAELLHAGTMSSSWEADFWRIVEASRMLQLRQVSLRVEEKGVHKRLTLRESALPAATQARLTTVASSVHLVQHAWALQDGMPVYDGRFLNSPDCLPLLSRYAGLLLATYGEQRKHLVQLRIAIYEICANIVEHGLRSRGPAHIDVHLHFFPGEIRGWVQDTCRPFDPSRLPATGIAERLEKRSTRGYGITIMRLLLDTMQHEFNPTGNRITFSKRIFQ